MKTRVQIVDPVGGSEITLDVSMNEQHSTTLTLTDQPVENGSTISDHAVFEPRTLQLEAFLSDFPLGGATSLVSFTPGQEGTTTKVYVETPNGLLDTALDIASEASGLAAASAVGVGLPSVPPGVAAGFTALGTAGNLVSNFRDVKPKITVVPGKEATSPQPPQIENNNVNGWSGRAKEIYNQLQLLQKRVTLLEVWTAFETYENMVIVSLSTPRNKDFSSGSVKVEIAFREVQIANSKAALLVETVPRTASKKDKGEQEGKENKPENVQSIAWELIVGYNPQSEAVTARNLARLVQVFVGGKGF